MSIFLLRVSRIDGWIDGTKDQIRGTTGLRPPNTRNAVAPPGRFRVADVTAALERMKVA